MTSVLSYKGNSRESVINGNLHVFQLGILACCLMAEQFVLTIAVAVLFATDSLFASIDVIAVAVLITVADSFALAEFIPVGAVMVLNFGLVLMLQMENIIKY